MDRVPARTTASGHDPETAGLLEQLDELTDALVTANDQLIALSQLNTRMSASLEPDVATERALREVLAMIEASGVAFFRQEDPREGNDSRPGITDPIAVGNTQVTPKAMLSAGPAGMARIDRRASDGRSRLIAPVRASDRTFGTIVAQAGNEGDFTTGDLKLLDAVANHLAVVLELASLHAAAVTQALVQHDHDTASTLAQAALSVPLPSRDGLDLAAVAVPARAAGGDFFAACPTPTGLYVALGDVSGKGLPAALVMTNAMWAVRAAFDRHPVGDVGAVLDDVDRQLADYLAEMAMFITMAVAHVDVVGGELTITNAGQSPVLVGGDRGIDRGVEAIATNGPPIGVLEPRRHEASRRRFLPRSFLFIGSDGCTDQRGANDEMLGESAVAGSIGGGGSRSSDQIIADLVSLVAEHRAGGVQDDDLTAIVVRCDGDDGSGR